jgi:hypothetical protein
VLERDLPRVLRALEREICPRVLGEGGSARECFGMVLGSAHEFLGRPR